MAKRKIKDYYNKLSRVYDKSVLGNQYEKYRFNCITKSILGLIPKKKGLRILDVGCGTGTFNILPIINHLGDADIYGIDISREMIQIASKRFPKLKFKVADAHRLPFESDFFDVVISRQVLEHLKEPLRALKEMKRVVKRGGTIIVSTPSWFGLIAMPYFIKKKLGKMQPIDNWFNPFLLKNLFRQAGLGIITMGSTNIMPYHKRLPVAFLPIVKFLDKELGKVKLFSLAGRILVVKAVK